MLNRNFKKGCKIIPNEVFDYLDSFNLNNVIHLDHISPFIYKYYNPDFQINNLHWDYLITPYRTKLFKLDPDFALLENYCNNEFYLNCHVKAEYDPNRKKINIKYDNSFEDFVKNHQIEVLLNYANDFLNILGFVLYDKLFYSSDKKTSGFLNPLKELFKNCNDFYPDIKFKTSPINPRIKNFLIEYEIPIEEYLDWLKHNGFGKKSKNTIQYESKKIKDIFDDLDIRLKYYFIKNKRICDVFKLSKSKKKSLLEILSHFNTEESKNYFINCFLHDENYKKLNDSLETILKIPNLKNKIKNLIDFFHPSDIIESSQLLKCVNFNNNLYDYENYDNLFSYVKWWLNFAKKFKYNKSDYLFIQGRFENNFANELNVLQSHEEFLTSLQNIENELMQMLKQKTLQESIPMLEPLNLEYKELYGFKIVELVTARQLQDEGDFQKHCVGGYQPKPNLRIFSIRWNNSGEEVRHTVQVSAQKVWQSQGKQRKLVKQYPEKESKLLKHIENYLVESMNKTQSEKIRKMSEEDLMLDELFE